MADQSKTGLDFGKFFSDPYVQRVLTGAAIGGVGMGVLPTKGHRLRNTLLGALLGTNVAAMTYKPAGTSGKAGEETGAVKQRGGVDTTTSPETVLPSDTVRTDASSPRTSLVQNKRLTTGNDFRSGSFSYKDKLEALYGKDQAAEFIRDATKYQAEHGGLDASGNNTAFGYRIGDVDKKIAHVPRTWAETFATLGAGGFTEPPTFNKYLKPDAKGNLIEGPRKSDEISAQRIALIRGQPFNAAIHESMHPMSTNPDALDPVKVRALTERAVNEKQHVSEYIKALHGPAVMPTNPKDAKLINRINPTGTSGQTYSNQIELLPIMSEMKQLGRSFGFKTRTPVDVEDFMAYLRKNKEVIWKNREKLEKQQAVSPYIRDPETLTSPEMEDTMKRLLPGIADAQSRMSYNNIS